MSNPLWGLALVMLCMTLAQAIVRLVPFYANEVGALNASRYGTIDGVRGFLALAVFLTHALSSFHWYSTGQWEWPPSMFYTLCGRIPVALFFMITGFLFWRKAIAGRLDWRMLYFSRLRRLAPLYLFCVPFVFVLIGIKTGWTLQVEMKTLFVSMVRWLGLGVLGRPDVNGLTGTFIIATAFWTLQYEWLFYLALPLMAMFATPRKIPALALLFAIGLLVLPDRAVAINFAFGMGAAHVLSLLPKADGFRSGRAALLALAGLVIVGLYGLDEYGILQSALIFPIFLSLVYGNTFFGLLNTRSARLLGMVSYSLYVVHCIVLYGCLHALDKLVPIASMAPAQFWLVIGLIGVIVVFISTLTFRWIEYPFMGPVDVRASVPHRRLAMQQAPASRAPQAFRS